MMPSKVIIPVTPTYTLKGTSAGVHNSFELLDSRLRGNDNKKAKQTFYEFIQY